MTANAETAPVTFVCSGLMLGSQVHLAGTWTEAPADIAALTPDEQRDQLGRHYFNPGIDESAIPASESYLSVGGSESPLLTTAEVAQLLRITAGHVRRMVEKGQLEEVRIGDGPRAVMRFRRSSLTRWLGPHGVYTDALGRTPPAPRGTYRSTPRQAGSSRPALGDETEVTPWPTI